MLWGCLRSRIFAAQHPSPISIRVLSLCARGSLSDLRDGKRRVFRYTQPSKLVAYPGASRSTSGQLQGKYEPLRARL